MIKLVERANEFINRMAIKSGNVDFKYDVLLSASKSVAITLLAGKNDLDEARVAFLVPPGFDYVRIQWGIWRAGGIAVPLCERHPLSSIKYVIEDTGASIIVYSGEYESLISPLINLPGITFLRSEAFQSAGGDLPDMDPQRRAMILYTSGTTGSPKGVVSTHFNIESQITSLVELWEWSPNDQILNVLPLHHVHGIINVLSCALWSGACCEFLPKFDAGKIFDLFRKGDINVFMAVPTIYFKLIAHWNQLSEEERNHISDCLKDFRLMVSGSAALPISVLEQWKRISHHTLLERYGMTEMGMAISNPYRGKRKPGYIGQALPGVEIRLADENDNLVKEGEQGEIQIKGPNVFMEYWRRPKETAESFTAEGWFKSGDIAVYKNGSYKILGRSSIDIIKSGGYKISALEIEEVLRTHPCIKDCGVVGIPDPEWGEMIGASLILKPGEFDFDQLKGWIKEKLPGYMIPRKYLIAEDLPRNVMGKVVKNELKDLFTE